MPQLKKIRKLISKLGLQLRCVPKNLISYFLTKTYVVGTQKNRLNETVLLGTKNICYG